MRRKSFMKRVLTIGLSSILLFTTVLPTFAAGTLSPQYTYSGGGVTFEKISHPDTSVEAADGIVDYVGNGSIAPYVAGESQSGNGDRGQSYSYASAAYGDWVYINTMYGGLGVSNILSIGMGGVGSEIATAAMNAMYNGNLYLGEPDGAYAGGVLLKYNVKTGETKILMSKENGGIIPTFRNAFEMNNKLYFVGMVIDVKSGMTPAEISKAIAMQAGFPCIYEVDPANNDKLTCIYNCVDLTGYRKLVDDNVFTSTRAIGTFKDSMIAGCLDTNGVFLCASKDPSAGQDSFRVIADMNDLFNYPAYHRSDVNGGGGIYQVIEYNNALYVVICTGAANTQNPATGTKKTFAIVKGVCNGEITDKSAWSWSVLAGDSNDGAKYPFGLDEERISAGACSLEVYDGYLYIGDYNDVSSALQGFVLKKDFTTQATNLEQSINLYRMDSNENVEKVVGDPTTRFPNSISGLGSGYSSTDTSAAKLGTHMNQYTWQTTVYNGKLYVSTMDTTTLLKPIAQFTNGDLLKLTPEEWKSQINYLRVLLELLFKSNDTPNTASENVTAMTTDSGNALDKNSALSMVQNASKTAAVRKADTSVSTFDFPGEANDAQSAEPIKLTDEQTDTLVTGLLDGSISSGQISEDQMNELTQMNNIMTGLTSLIDTTDVQSFANTYGTLVDQFSRLTDWIPESIKNLYNMLLSFMTKDNLTGLAKSVTYLKDSEAGFDLFEITNNSDGSVSIVPVTTNGFGDRYNHGLRIFEKTADYWILGTANPFYGTQLWRTQNLDPEPVPPEKPTEPVKPEDPTKPADPVQPANPVKPTDTVKPAAAKVVQPKTGDENSIIPMIALVITALGTIGATIVVRRKR